jgi:transposase-like protein
MACLTRETGTRFTFINYPVAYRLHARTANAIESTSAIVITVHERGNRR